MLLVLLVEVSKLPVQDIVEMLGFMSHGDAVVVVNVIEDLDVFSAQIDEVKLSELPDMAFEHVAATGDLRRRLEVSRRRLKDLVISNNVNHFVPDPLTQIIFIPKKPKAIFFKIKRRSLSHCNFTATADVEIKKPAAMLTEAHQQKRKKSLLRGPSLSNVGVLLHESQSMKLPNSFPSGICQTKNRRKTSVEIKKQPPSGPSCLNQPAKPQAFICSMDMTDSDVRQAAFRIKKSQSLSSIMMEPGVQLQSEPRQEPPVNKGQFTFRSQSPLNSYNQEPSCKKTGGASSHKTAEACQATAMQQSPTGEGSPSIKTKLSEPHEDNSSLAESPENLKQRPMIYLKPIIKSRAVVGAQSRGPSMGTIEHLKDDSYDIRKSLNKQTNSISTFEMDWNKQLAGSSSLKLNTVRFTSEKVISVKRSSPADSKADLEALYGGGGQNFPRMSADLSMFLTARN